MIDNPPISARCARGAHYSNRPGCRAGAKLCSCKCHTTAMVRVAMPKGTGKAKMVPIHEIGCSKKPCVCSDICAGKAAKKIVTGLARLFVEALFKPAESKNSCQPSGQSSEASAVPSPSTPPAGPGSPG